MITELYKGASFDRAKYFLGSPCPFGNTAPRRISDRKCTCAECSSYRTKRYKAAKAQQYQRNREKRLKMARDWVVKNRDRRNAAKRARHLSNPAPKVMESAKRRARKLNATPSWYGELDDFVMLEAAELCRLRAAATGSAWQVDHMIPLQAREACGLHWAMNLQVVPAAINAAKMNRMVLIAPGAWIGAL
jgi:hypothetical protein